MPIEYAQLKDKPPALLRCPKCGDHNPTFLRGMVQRSKRFLWILWKRPYCAVICNKCKEIVGYESPEV